MGILAPPSLEEQHKFLDKAKAQDWPAVRAMLEEKPDLVNAQPLGRWSAIHQFASSNNTEAVKVLLSFGANKSAITKDGKTVLDVAKGECAALLGDDVEESEDAMEEDARAPARPESKPSGSGGGGASDAKKRKPPASPDRGAAPKKAKVAKPVDPVVPGRESYTVVDDWSVLLNQTNLGANNNKYYKIQLLQGSDGTFYSWTHWGRVGAVGQHKLEPCADAVSAQNACEKKFKEKSGVLYCNRLSHDWTPVIGKYTLVETDEQEGDDGGESAPLGKLTPQQIEKGQGVLEKIEEVLNTKSPTEIMDLSSQFYTLIPHNFGMKVPPPINTPEMLEAEQELLKFYLRMGFDEMEKADDGLLPVSGIMDLELPKSLESACSKLCSAKDIKASSEKGKTHADRNSGKPTKAMEPHLYAAIMLYTSNAIYRNLNSTLRSEDRGKIKKYFLYLRLLLEALGRLPQSPKDLWRGVNVDLFDTYPLNSTITWWAVSSCTADISVAKNFMNGCGGKCTLLTVNSKTAADISDITFFGNEKEHLLAPGTQLKVVSSVRKGKTTEIIMEEVGRVLN